MSIFIYVFVGVLAGAFFPIQASINARLRVYTKTPLTASFIAFSVGSIVLFLLLLIFDTKFYVKIDFSYPMTVFIGGAVSGLIFNVANIVLFAKIGATITTLTTIVGQVIMGIVLDHFGVLNLPIQELSLMRILGIVIMIIAIILYQRVNYVVPQQMSKWVVLGVIVGIFPPLQSVFNGQLRWATNSILTSTFLSFLIGALLLVILILITEKRINIPTHDQNNRPIPLWVYTGGVFGILIVGGTIIVIHHLGAVLTSLVFIFGQLLMAVIIDHFGWLGLVQRKVTAQKVVSLMLMVVALFVV